MPDYRNLGIGNPANYGGSSGVPTSGGAAGGMDFRKLLTDPNFLQYVAGAGRELSTTGNVGAALDPSRYIENVQVQNSNEELIRRILGTAQPTPKGQFGPDKATVQQTADGSKITFDIMSDKNLNSFGENVPLENQTAPKQSGSDSSVPFFKALLR